MAVLIASGIGLLVVGSVWIDSLLTRTAVTVGVPLLAAATAYVLDEAASEAVAAVPTSLRARSVSRLIVAAAIVALGAAALGVVSWRSGDGAKAGIAVQLAGLALVAVAAAATMRRRVVEPGEVVAGGLLAAVLALALAHPLDRWVDVFPSEAGQRWTGSLVLWGLAGLVSLAGLYAATRDPLD